MIKKGEDMLILPTTSGYIVDYESDEVSKRTGKRIWKEVLCTKDKKKAEEKVAELKNTGLNARMLEAIF